MLIPFISVINFLVLPRQEIECILVSEKQSVKHSVQSYEKPTNTDAFVTKHLVVNEMVFSLARVKGLE